MASHSRNPSTAGDRKTTSTSARPRVASAGHETKRTSAHSRSQATKESGNSSAADRRAERSSKSIRESVTITTRTRSPLKPSSESRVNGSKSRESMKASKPEPPSPLRKSEDKPALPWNPEASIVPHTSAPLASRISVPPLASTAPPNLEPQPLGELPVEKQEAAIIEDLLFVFMGFEGQYIQYEDSYNPEDIKERLVGPRFRILAGLDPSLRDLTLSMLRMATHYVAVEAFVEVQSKEEYGSVNHALCAAVRKLLQDYLTLIAQLEHQMLTNPTFTLHLLNLHTKPTSHMLFQLYTLGIEVLKANGVLEDENTDDSSDESDNIEDILETLKEGGAITSLQSKKVCKGGNVIGLITRRLASMSGDPAAKELLTLLLRDASRPYMTMLNEWLHHGGIKDPHAEFLIKEQKSIKKDRLDQDYTDEYWEKRYTIRENLVPPQLEGVKDKVLLAGKYLNVVRECGGVDVSKGVAHVPTTFDDPGFLENVNSAYTYANSSLLDLLLTTHELPARLRSLKHYFFGDRADFFSYFLELGASELKKSAKLVNIGKLQTLLDIVLRQPGSVAADDPFKEDVKITINEVGLTDWLMKIVNVTGLDQDAPAGSITNYVTPAANSASTEEADIKGFQALVLDYIMPFPLSLVVSRVTLTRYQLLFRFLLSLRHLESQLSGTWADHSKVTSWKHRSRNPKVELYKRKAWTLRARMLIFVQQLLYYCTSEVIEPNWQKFMSRLETPDGATKEELNGSMQVKRTVDELMQDHVDFLATCLKECMLTNSKLLRINSKVIQTCTYFTRYNSSASRYLVAVDADLARASAVGTSSNQAGHLKSASSSMLYDPSKLDKMMDDLKRFEDNFGRHLRIMLDTLNYLAATETVVFLSLCARLSTANEGGGGSDDAGSFG